MKCVPELKPENVSIVDSTIHDVGEDGEYDAEYLSQLQLTELLKETLTEQVLRVLDPAFGK